MRELGSSPSSFQCQQQVETAGGHQPSTHLLPEGTFTCSTSLSCWIPLLVPLNQSITLISVYLQGDHVCVIAAWRLHHKEQVTRPLPVQQPTSLAPPCWLQFQEATG